MARLALDLLGSLHVTLDDQPIDGFAYDKVRALLAYLAVEARPHRRDALAELLWPDQPAAAARTNLRVALITLRRALGDQTAQPPFLLTTRETVQLNPDSDVALDVTAFNDLLQATERHAHSSEALCATCVPKLTQAVALYRGELLQQVMVRDSMAYDEWLTLTRERLHRQALEALGQLAGYHEERGEDEQTRQYAWRTLQLERWDEAAHRCLMRMLARSGQRAAALAQYERCRKVLAEDLGVEPAAETTTLYQQICTGTLACSLGRSPASTPTADLADDQHSSAPTNLPASLSPLIGREQELARLRAQMRDKQTRLLTLVGPPGIGKTRLALQGAAELRADCSDGVFFVALAPISDSQLVAPVIAGVLGLADAGELPLLERLKRYMHSKQILLILDNFEQVTAAAPLLAELLAAAPKLKILVTSRATLRISGEREYAVPPLALPNLQRLPPPADLARVAAVALFVQRAQAVDTNFTLTTTNAPAVAEICSRLDGLPLAIELAAARSKLFVPAALLKRLDRRLALLTDGPRDLPPRQRTLRDTIAWSYDLLTPAEQRLLRRLAVFVGGCSLEAAEAVCDSDGDLGIAVVDGLAALVDKSLLQHEEGPASELRLMMLETIREYALEQLANSGELENLRRRHAAFFATLAEGIHPALRRPGYRTLLDRLEMEHPNFRAALAWSRTEADGTTGLRLVLALDWFWRRLGYLSEGRGWLVDILASRAGGASRSATAASRSLRAKALSQLGDLAGWQSDWAASQLAYEESLAVFRELGDMASISGVLGGLGMLFVCRGDYERSGACLEESLSLCRQLGEIGHMIWCLFFQGTLAYTLGDLRRARALWEESLTLGRPIGDPWNIGTDLLHLGIVAREQGDDRRASSYLVESLTLFRDFGDRWQTALALDVFAGLIAAQGHRREDAQPYGRLAARIFGAAEALRETLGAPLLPIYRDHYQRGVEAARALLDEPTFAAAWAEGRAITLEQAIAEALEWSKAAISTDELPAPRSPPTNLPAPPTPLIGRERELADLSALLRRPEVRLVTLTGAGGSGKTRLALELAAALRDTFSDGVFLVELAPVREAGLVATTIATALGLKNAGGQSLVERLIAYLQKRRVLLLLDNFEHVAEAAPLLAALLGACWSLKLLVTSRAPLHLRGEREVEVGPLALPNLQRPAEPDSQEQAAAVGLFIARVQDVRPNFHMTPENAASINEICVRLDGLPLALELAAARVKLLSPQALLARLGSRLKLLTGGARDLPTRQQTLRDTITWSYDLLTPTTQRLFRRLAVFVGGWTLEVAVAVCDVDGDLGLDVLDGMQALVDQSLVRQEPGLDGKPRFRILETIREYALERLGTSGELETLGQRHATFFVTLAETAHRPQEVAWLDRLEAEHANLRAALAWSRTEVGGETGLRLAVALRSFYADRGHLSEGREWVTVAVTQSQAGGSTGQNTRKHLLLRAQALDWIGIVASWQGDLAAAQSALEASLILSRELENSKEIAGTLGLLGMLLQMRGEYERAGALLGQSLTLAREIGDTNSINWCHVFLGILMYSQGNARRACELWEESLIGFRARDDTWGMASAHSYLGMVMLDQGNHGQAKAHLWESLTRLWEFGDRWQLAFGLELCARLVAQAQRQEDGQLHGLRATRLFGAAEALRERLGTPQMSFQQVSYQRGVAAARALLDEESFAAAWAAGRAMPLEQAIDEALDWSAGSMS